jgi:hypothetical protein
LLRSVEGSGIALTLSSLSLFLFLYQWSPSRHLLKSKVGREDAFFAARILLNTLDRISSLKKLSPSSLSMP